MAGGEKTVLDELITEIAEMRKDIRSLKSDYAWIMARLDEYDISVDQVTDNTTSKI